MTTRGKQTLFWTVTVVGAIALFPLMRDLPPQLLFWGVMLIAAGQMAFVSHVLRKQSKDQ